MRAARPYSTTCLALVSAALVSAILLEVGPAEGKRAELEVAEEAARGDAWALAGRCDEAVVHYRKALATGAEARLRGRMAQCLVAAERVSPAALAEAQRLVDEGLAERRDAGLLLVAGSLAARREAWSAAVALYSEVEAGATRSPLAREARRGRLVALAALGTSDTEYRRVAVELAQTIASDAEEAVAQRAWAEEQGAELRYQATGRAIVSARRKLAEGDAEGALGLLEPIVAREPAIGEAQYLRGLALRSPGIGRRKEASAAFRKAAGIKEAALELGIEALEEGDLETAASQLNAAIALDGRYQAALYHLALVERERGRSSQAREAFARAARVDPESALGKQAATKHQLLTGQVHALVEGQVIDAAEEVALGQAIADKVAARFGARSDVVLQPRLERILRRLTAVADRPERELRYRVQLVEAAIPNALTLPGGTILVFRGLADLVKKDLGDSDDAWAAILGHECAHAALRHGVGMMRMASSLSGASAFDGGAGDLAQLMNTISRAHEFEADQFGALYAYRAGFAPGASLALHAAMVRAGGEIPRGMTHPTHAERVAGLHDYLLELRAKVRGFDLATKSLAEGALEAAVVRLEVFLGVFPDSLSARSNLGVALHRKAIRGLLASATLRRVTDVDPESRARKIELRSAVAKDAPSLDRRLLEAAVVEYRSALVVDPSYAPALVNLGAALFDLGDARGARLSLDRAVARAPRAPEAWINRATVAEAEGKPAEAEADLRRALSLDERSAVAWFDLALICEDLGRRDEARAAWVRYLELDTSSGWAELARARHTALQAAGSAGTRR